MLKFVGMVVHKVRRANFVMHIDSISIPKDQSYKYFLCLQFTIKYNKLVFVPESIRLGYIGLQETNSLDYYKHTYLNYRRKKIYSIGPWGNIPNTLLFWQKYVRNSNERVLRRQKLITGNVYSLTEFLRRLFAILTLVRFNGRLNPPFSKHSSFFSTVEDNNNDCLSKPNSNPT